MMTRAHRQTLVFAGLVVAVPLCVAYADRRVADLSQEWFYATLPFAIARRLFQTLHAGLIVLIVTFIVTAVVLLCTRRLTGRPLVLFRCTAAALTALVVTLAVKFAVGRSKVYPAYLVQHVYEFRPFRGGDAYGEFPSATMAVIGAMLTTLRGERRLWRVVCAAAMMLVGISLLITNGHWLSDVLAGWWLGAFIGARFSAEPFDAQIPSRRHTHDR